MNINEAVIPIVLAEEKLRELTDFTVKSASLRFLAAGHTVDEALRFSQDIITDVGKMLNDATDRAVEELAARGTNVEAEVARLRAEAGLPTKDDSFGIYL